MRAVQKSLTRRGAQVVLRSKPRILRGLTWNLLGYVALIAMAFDVKEIILAMYWSGKVDWSWLLTGTLSGLFVLICAIVLTNTFSRGTPRPVILAVALVLGCTVALLVSAWILDLRITSFGQFFNRFRVNVLEWGMVIAVYYFIECSERRAAGLRKAELERRRLEAQMIETHLQVMQSQVEPHFLFNTLAHIQRLYQTDPQRARSMLDSFCGYLRSALPQMRAGGSTLGKEVELARAYLDTHRIRMGRRLRLNVAIPDDLRAASFPPMMLLSLVENAIKHGLNPLREGGSIAIAGASDDAMLRVSVADTGAGLSKVELRGGGKRRIEHQARDRLLGRRLGVAEVGGEDRGQDREPDDDAGVSRRDRPAPVERARDAVAERSRRERVHRQPEAEADEHLRGERPHELCTRKECQASQPAGDEQRPGDRLRACPGAHAA